MMYSSTFKTSHQDLGGTYIAPEISMVLRVQISELERSDFNYVNLFGPETVAEVGFKDKNEPSHLIMVLFVLRKLILQTRMCSHPVGLDVWFLVGPFVCLHLTWAFAGRLCNKYH